MIPEPTHPAAAAPEGPPAASGARPADPQDRLDGLRRDIEAGCHVATTDLIDLVRIAQAVRGFHEAEALRLVARLLGEDDEAGCVCPENDTLALCPEHGYQEEGDGT